MNKEIVILLAANDEAVDVTLLLPSGRTLGSSSTRQESLLQVIDHWRKWKAESIFHEEDLHKISKALSEAILTDSLRCSLQETIRTVEPSESLRLIVEYADRWLGEAPWELLSISKASPLDPAEGFLALLPQVQIARRTVPPTPKRREKPANLRILAVASDPRTPRHPPLAFLSAETRAIEAACHRAKSDGASLKLLANAVPAVLERTLREFRPHVFHFSGHGEARPSGGVLILQGATANTASVVPASDIARWLAASGVQLAVLSACDTAGSADGIAEEIISQGIDSVVAMQASTRDAWQPQFSRIFYGALLDSATVEQAVSEARHSLAGIPGAWSIPALFVSGNPHALAGSFQSDAAEDHPHNLPSLGPIVGRESEISRIAHGLDQTRTITLTGPGGVGKTRLAMEVGQRLLPRFPDGVWMIPGETVASKEDLYSVIVGALGITLTKTSAAEAVRQHFRDKHLLLILDCCEGFAANGPVPAIPDLLSGTSVSCLLTSRRSLGFEGEAPLEIQPLAVASEPNLESPAVELFLNAGKINGAALKPESRQTIGDICQLLEGIPLAIILAAGHVKVLELGEILLLLQENGRRALEGEEAPVSKAIRRSLGLLSDPERTFLWQLSLFQGGFTRDDVSSVYLTDRFELLNDLSKLTENSLVLSTAFNGGKRFRLLDTIREYMIAINQGALQSWEHLDALQKHAARFCAKAQTIAQLMREGEWDQGGTLLWADLGNFRAALAFCSENRRHEQIALLVDSLARTLMEAGLWTDFQEFLTQGYRSAEALGNVALTIRLLGIEGAMAYRLGDPARGHAIWTRRAALSDHIGDHKSAADAMIDLAVQSFQEGEVQEGMALLNTAETYVLQDRAPALLATIAVLRGRTFARQNAPAEAAQWAVQAEALLQETDDLDSHLYVDLNLGRIWTLCGNLEKAERAYFRVIETALKGTRHIQTAIAALELSDLYVALEMPETAIAAAIAAARLLENSKSHRRQDARLRLERLTQSNPNMLGWLERRLRATPIEDLISDILRRTPKQS